MAALPEEQSGLDAESIIQGESPSVQLILKGLSANGENPEAAEQWIRSLPNAELAAAVAGQQTLNLMAKDPAQVSKWLDSLPADSPLREAIVKARQKFEANKFPP